MRCSITSSASANRSSGIDVVAAVDQRPRARRLDQRDAGPRAGPQLDARVPPRAADELDDVLEERVADVDRRAPPPSPRRARSTEPTGSSSSTSNSVRAMAPLSSRRTPSAMLRRRTSRSSSSVGIVEPVAEHEAVELRLGQLERAALLDRVLRGDDQERRRQLERLLADRDLALLHRLEQGALHLRRGAVDLVGQQQVGEDRPLVDAELVACAGRGSPSRGCPTAAGRS